MYIYIYITSPESGFAACRAEGSEALAGDQGCPGVNAVIQYSIHSTAYISTRADSDTNNKGQTVRVR